MIPDNYIFHTSLQICFILGILFAYGHVISDDSEHGYRQHHSTKHHKTPTEEFTTSSLWVVIPVPDCRHGDDTPIHTGRDIVEVRLFVHVQLEEVDETTTQYHYNDHTQEQRGVHICTRFDGQTDDSKSPGVFGQTEKSEDAEYLAHVLKAEDVVGEGGVGFERQHDEVGKYSKHVDPGEETPEEPSPAGCAHHTTPEVKQEPHVEGELPDGERSPEVDFSCFLQVGKCFEAYRAHR